MKISMTIKNVPTSPWSSADIHSVDACLNGETVHVGSYGAQDHAQQRVRIVRRTFRRAGGKTASLTRTLFPAWEC